MQTSRQTSAQDLERKERQAKHAVETSKNQPNTIQKMTCQILNESCEVEARKLQAKLRTESRQCAVEVFKNTHLSILLCQGIFQRPSGSRRLLQQEIATTCFGNECWTCNYPMPRLIWAAGFLRQIQQEWCWMNFHNADHLYISPSQLSFQTWAFQLCFLRIKSNAKYLFLNDWTSESIC